ncbi:MAG: helix-turn-helix transcriptional regulator [Oscillospiraceae bacterium]|nr:helix-turn-helix transcriptional regulator [Oscillospiraceae bacterium]
MNNIIGRNIRAKREELGMDQRELAGRAGISAAAVSKIEKGKNIPMADTLRKIAKALHCDMERFFDGIEVS